jgi:hypothetical protein
LIKGKVGRQNRKISLMKTDRTFEKLNRLWDLNAKADVGLQYCEINGRELRKREKDILDI